MPALSAPLQWAIALSFVVVVALLGWFGTRRIASGPEITLTHPTSATIPEESSLTITGTTRNIAFIELNHHPFFINQSGEFEEEIALFPGYNVFRITARDRFQRVTEKTVTLWYPANHNDYGQEDIKNILNQFQEIRNNERSAQLD